MSQFALIKIVATREFTTRARSKAFLIAMACLNLAIIAAIVVPTLGNESESQLRIGIVAGEADALVASIEVVHEQQREQDPESLRYDIITFTSFDSAEVANSAVRNNDVDLAFLDDHSVSLKGGSVSASSRVPNIVWTGAQLLQLETSSAVTGLSTTELVALTSPDLEVELLEGDEVDGSKLFTAYAGMMATYMAILLFGSWTLAGVLEEKSSKVVETIVSTVRPQSLLAGKIIGIGAVALVQIGVALAVGVLGINMTGALDDFGGVPTASLLVLGLWFLVGFALYNTLFAATGALVSRVEDAQAASMPLTMISMVAMGVSLAVLNDPDGTLAKVATFVPLIAPFAVPIRFAQDAISVAGLIASLLTTVLFTLAAVVGAGRVYEGALLRSGGRVKVIEAWRGDR